MPQAAPLSRSTARVPLPAAPSENALDRSIRLAQENLLRAQHGDGHWCYELFVDSTLCSDYVLFMHWRGKVNPVLQEK